MKLSDYILEQDISSASIADIHFEQCFAEMNVFATALDCCMKQETILEYASGDIEDFTIFQEGMFMEADKSDKEKAKDSVKEKKEFFLKRWAKAFWELLKKVGRSIADWFTKVDYSSLKKKVESSDTQSYYFDYPPLNEYAKNIEALIKTYEEFVNLIDSRAHTREPYLKIKNEVEKIEKNVKSIEATEITKDNGGPHIQKHVVINFLTTMEELQKKEIPKFKKILQKGQFNLANFDTTVNTDKEALDLIKEIGKKLPVMYSKLNDVVLKTTAEMIKGSEKKRKKVGDDEYYQRKQDDEPDQMVKGASDYSSQAQDDGY